MPRERKTAVRLLVAQAVLREGLRLLIDAEPDLRIVPTDAEDASVLLIDANDEGALDQLGELAAGPGRKRCIVLCDRAEPDELDAVFKAGASGVVVKSAHPASLLQAVRSVGKGLRWLDPEIQERLMSADSVLPSPSERWDSLTNREREVATRVLDGLRYKEIADSLHISDHTVRNHLRNIFTKLQISSRVELAPYADKALSS